MSRKFHPGEFSVVAGIALILLTVCVWAQEPSSVPSAQPSAETQVAQQFKEVAPQLFKEWLERRPGVLKKLTLGQRVEAPGCPGASWFEFIECADIAPPVEYQIDVTRTDSILTPFLGKLVVPVREGCSVRRLVPGALRRDNKSVAKLDPYCLGKTYNECVAGGAKPISKFSPGGCMGSPGGTFTHEMEVSVTYRWSEGKWEFEGEKGDKLVPPKEK